MPATIWGMDRPSRQFNLRQLFVIVSVLCVAIALFRGAIDKLDLFKPLFVCAFGGWVIFWMEFYVPPWMMSRYLRTLFIAVSVAAVCAWLSAPILHDLCELRNPRPRFLVNGNVKPREPDSVAKWLNSFLP